MNDVVAYTFKKQVFPSDSGSVLYTTCDQETYHNWVSGQQLPDMKHTTKELHVKRLTNSNMEFISYACADEDVLEILGYEAQWYSCIKQSNTQLEHDKFVLEADLYEARDTIEYLRLSETELNHCRAELESIKGLSLVGLIKYYFKGDR